MEGSIKFDDYKEAIIKAINQKVSMGQIPPDSKGYALLEGFINVNLVKEIHPSINFIGSNYVPSIAIVGNSSGLVFTFAVKILIPSFPM